LTHKLFIIIALFVFPANAFCVESENTANSSDIASPQLESKEVGQETGVDLETRYAWRVHGLHETCRHLLSPEEEAEFSQIPFSRQLEWLIANCEEKQKAEEAEKDADIQAYENWARRKELDRQIRKSRIISHALFLPGLALLGFSIYVFSLSDPTDELWPLDVILLSVGLPMITVSLAYATKVVRLKRSKIALSPAFNATDSSFTLGLRIRRL
jgi:hypothetical protein